MSSEQLLNSKHVETDIVIVGAGGAGLTAAVTAAEKGAKVIVIEKGRKPGGLSAMAGGLFAAESPVQKRLRCDVSKEEIFKLYMEFTHWKPNPRVVRAFIDKSGDTIQWLEDKGVVFEHICSNYPGQFPLTWHCMPPRMGGIIIVKMLTEQCEYLDIQILNKCPAKRVMKNKEGKITGVLVETEDGEMTIETKAVIIATGGYGGNKDMLKKYYPLYNENMIHLGKPHKGEGLQMAMEAGAATESLGMLLTHGPMCPGPGEVDALARQPETVWVNKFGERFVDETITLRFPECGNAFDRQPDGVSYNLLDEAIKQDRTQRGISHLHVSIVAATPLEKVDESFERAVKKGVARISDSWDDIAKWMGADPKVLNATIDEYNSSCDKGYDNLFGKTHENLKALKHPPFYAMKCYGSFLNTVGGIMINERMEALDKKTQPISGLYVIGNDAGGWIADTYNLSTASGTAFGFAINSGRIAGEDAAEYVK
ncbi:FAD-dependent oxidoreductase [Thermodesulfobacteriota bacterium]